MSTDEQAREGVSLDAQRSAIEERAPGALLFSDVLSGSRADRPGYQQMLAGAAAGEFDELLVWKFDRLGRDAEELLRARRMLAAADVSIVSLTEGDSESVLVFGMHAILSEVERQKIGERTRLGLRAIAASGRSPCGAPPLGYRAVGERKNRRWVVQESEVEILRRIDSEYLAGRGVSAIARGLNADGVPTVSAMRKVRRAAGCWSPRPILDILDNPSYRGLIRHKSELFDGSHEPLRDAATWEQIQALRHAKRAQGGLRGPKPKRHLLTNGMLRCGRCGGGMSARTNPQGYDYYLCSRRHTLGVEACSMPTIARAAVDDALLGDFLELFHDEGGSIGRLRQEVDRRVAEAEAAAAAAEREGLQLEEQLTRIRSDYRAGEITPAEWREFVDEIGAERSAVAAKVELLERQAVELAAAGDRIDTEAEFAARLAEVRDVAAGRIVGAGQDVEAVRAALLTVFESVTLHGSGEFVFPNPRMKVGRRDDGVYVIDVHKAALNLESIGESNGPLTHLLKGLFGPVPVGGATRS